MTPHQLIRTALVAALLALALLVIAAFLAMTGNPPAGQEQFETISSVADYAARMAAAGPGLRRILFIDGLFMLSYTVAIGFAVLAFANNNRAAAWIGGVGIVIVMLLDAFENATMAQSADILAAGGTLTLDRIAFQAAISGMKWQSSAAALLAVSFVLPYGTMVEKLLVWGVRLGLPVAVPIFIMGAFDARALGGLMLLASMTGGFVLLALVLRGRLSKP